MFCTGSKSKITFKWLQNEFKTKNISRWYYVKKALKIRLLKNQIYKCFSACL